MATNNPKELSYKNTLIFTIIAAIISILLLLVLLMKNGRQYLPFIVTLECGIFFIILMCITQIYINEQNVLKYMNSKDKIVTFSKCPDYFTKRTIGDKEICSNEYIYFDDNKNKFILKIYPLSTTKTIAFPTNHITTYDSNAPPKKYEKFPLNEIQTAADLSTVAEKCSVVTSPPGGKLSAYDDYSLIPWTTMRARCETV